MTPLTVTSAQPKQQARKRRKEVHQLIDLNQTQLSNSW